jgi:hypothetical protein
MLLMLIDTPDPRYRPGDEPVRRDGWRPNPRVWLPCLGAVLCILVAGWVPPLAAYVLIIVGLCLFFDGASSAWPKDGLAHHWQ